MQTCGGFAALCSLLHALPLFTVRSSIIAIFWTIVLGIIGSIIGGAVTHMSSRPTN